MDSYKTDYTSFDIYHDVLVPASLILHVENYIKASFPYIRVNWLHRNREEVLHQVSNTSNSMAIMQNRMSNMAEKNLGFMNLGTDKLAIYCHPKHALTNISDLTSADLQSEKQYVSENHIHTLPDVFSVSVDQHVISNNDVLLSLLVHDGWAFLSKNLAAPLVQSGHLVELHPTELSVAINIGISFYFPLSMQNSEELEGLKETLKFYSNEHMT
ncbi:transcriptional regulators LysR family [Vibrio maritimus]|uniref:Transcriptional regulators LysR family n=1 Tax=Vibrio maritimus TaxID=990268 RepID=A0A090SXD3_9VIBR|nr:transcriptional regulators LysR family [Vibrio maritimus]